MNKYSNTEKDIHVRIYRFVVDCFRDVVRKIPKSIENSSIISQIAAALTSMGANDREADASGSQKDFIARYVIVRKETNETIYWLSLIRDLGLISSTMVESYIKEGEEIFKIVSAIIKNSRH